MSGSAKMLVGATGGRLGTVGGGCLEAEIAERALDVAERRQPALSEHTLNSELAGDYGLTCGGTAVMFIEPVFPSPLLAELYARCALAESRGERGVLATGSDWSTGIAKLLLLGEEESGSGNDSLRAAALAFDEFSELPDLRGDVLVEPVSAPPPLVVFGGGHVGASVAQAAAFAGWRVTVVDDREEYADPARLPFADRTVVCAFHELPPTLGLDAASYVVIATRGHQQDAVVAEQLARMELRYLGMLGSRRKVALTRRLLEGEGIPAERLERMHAPVGLPIGADTPREIAISVVAEMIAVRREGTRRRGRVGTELLAERS